MDISKHFDRGLQVLDQDWLSLENKRDFIHKLENLLLLDVEWLHWRDSALTSFRLEQILDEERIKGLIVVLLDEWGLDVGAKLLGLFLELVDRYLTHHQRKVLDVRLVLDTVLVDAHGDVSLSSQLELLLLYQVVDVLILCLCCLPWAALCRALLWVLRVNFSSEPRMVREQLCGIDP